MKKILTAFFCVSLLLTFSIEAQNARWASADDPVALQLIAMETMWSDLSCGPQPGIDKMFAEEFQGTATNGTRYGKEDAMDYEGGAPDRDCRLGEVRIQFFGNKIAVAYGNESSIRTGLDGQEFLRCLAWTDTWLKRHGKWQLIAAQDNVVNCDE